jgi:hypothetical protein
MRAGLPCSSKADDCHRQHPSPRSASTAIIHLPAAQAARIIPPLRVKRAGNSQEKRGSIPQQKNNLSGILHIEKNGYLTASSLKKDSCLALEVCPEQKKAFFFGRYARKKNGFSHFEYELRNHLTNVLVTVSDRRNPDVISGSSVARWKPYVVTANDYYLFGMTMPGRSFARAGKSYRYSINGQEKTPEIAPGTTTAEYWEYDSRIGRRWNVDPKPVESVSVYATFLNNPLRHVDIRGDTGILPGIATPFNLSFLKAEKKPYTGWFSAPWTFAQNTATSALNQGISSVENLPKVPEQIKTVYSGSAGE